MRRSRSIWLGLVTVGTAAAIGLALRWREPAKNVISPHRAAADPQETAEPSSLDPSNETAQVAAQLAKLNSAVSELRGRLATRDVPGAVGEDPSSAEEIEDSIETSRLKWQEHMAQAEDKFKKERIDPAWARETSMLIERELAAEPNLRASLRSMECRAQSCRLELNENDAAAGDGSEHALPLFLHRLGTALPVTQSDLVDSGNGKMVRVVFLLKESES